MKEKLRMYCIVRLMVPEDTVPYIYIYISLLTRFEYTCRGTSVPFLLKPGINAMQKYLCSTSLTTPASVTLFHVQQLVSSRMNFGAGPLVNQWMSVVYTTGIF